MDIKNTTDLKVALRAGPYAWPGGYPTYFIAADGEPLCHNCVKQNFKQAVYEAYRPRQGDMFRVIGQEINYEDNHLYCAHCEQPIETACSTPENNMNYTKKQIGSKNAYRLHFPNGAEFLQSYATPVACYIPGLGFMATTTKFSTTTTRQINHWRKLHGYPLVAAVEQREIEDWMYKMETAR